MLMEYTEAAWGFGAYATEVEGIGGVIKKKPEDFTVWEILFTGLNALDYFKNNVGYAEIEQEHGRHALYAVKKVNMETLKAVKLIAHKVGVKPYRVGVCGIKDKRSTSYIFISVPRVRNQPTRIEDTYGESILEARLVGAVKTKLTSKNLYRNRFAITIRGVEAGRDRVYEILDAVNNTVGGFPNFFGHQRFGVIRPVTHLIGRAIVKGDYELAVRTLLFATTAYESEKHRIVREEAHNLFNMNKPFSHLFAGTPLHYEKQVARWLELKRGDYLAALQSLPTRLRRLFTQSYASYLFNMVLSRILKRKIALNEVEAGDLVVMLDMYGMQAGRPTLVNLGNRASWNRLIQQGKAALVIPVVGYSTTLPRSSKGEVIREVLEEEKIEPRNFRLEATPETSSPGEYRRALVNPEGLYVDEAGGESSTLLVSFSLPRGAYATSILRELMKPKTPLAFLGRESIS
ncbi:MAG TPA: tRNA pseudouridine(13) synthase TruD [Candidatus Caldiarchaeum subterraneum]|uniref:Probable tRNA pseudouridine synthase D n=1 Tax=Caldiarchaeum subterraneum TaxID=311458 RepID=A0A832ZW37_CALS0|nr:tRNA pseudouridine(13) synthase TruD [Candidatus Caldarchaeum subterraneum]